MHEDIQVRIIKRREWKEKNFIDIINMKYILEIKAEENRSYEDVHILS